MKISEWRAFSRSVEFLLEAERSVSVRAQAPALAEADLELSLPQRGRGLNEVLARLVEVGLHTPNTASPRFFNQLFGGRIPAATFGDMLAALFNNSMYTYKVAGPHVLIENELLAHMTSLAGFVGGEGTFTPGGSLSNLLAMIVARGEVFDGTREAGMTELKPTIYTSSEGHYSIRKNAGLMGVGRDNVRTVKTDDRGRMLPADLRACIERDLADGRRPFFVNLTAGTTVLGAFDPIPELSEVARAYGLWVHVDGALGGSMLVSPRARERLEGIELADSLTWDAHKTMGVPLTSSVCLLRRRGLLAKHLSESADYLFQDDQPRLDPGQTSMQCGRRNDALKLWAAWQNLGDDGYAARIDRMLDLAAYAAARIRAEPELRLVKTPESVNVCFTVDRAPTEGLCRALVERQRAVVGHAQVNGEAVVRLVCINPDLRESDIDTFFDEILRTAAELRPAAAAPSPAPA